MTVAMERTPSVTMGTVVAELRDVSKSFDSTRAVRDLTVSLRAGEVLVLLGENGAGKSTCVKMFAGVYACHQPCPTSSMKALPPSCGGPTGSTFTKQPSPKLLLVGYYLWLEADKGGWKLDQTNVQRGIAAAQRRNTLVVVESALSNISDRDREFLNAMAAQDGPSAAGQIGPMITMSCLLSFYGQG